MSRVRAGDHRFRWNAAGVDARSAEEMPLDDGDRHAGIRQSLRKRRPRLAGADDDRVVILVHRTSVLDTAATRRASRNLTVDHGSSATSDRTVQVMSCRQESAESRDARYTRSDGEAALLARHRIGDWQRACDAGCLPNHLRFEGGTYRARPRRARRRPSSSRPRDSRLPSRAPCGAAPVRHTSLRSRSCGRRTRHRGRPRFGQCADAGGGESSRN